MAGSSEWLGELKELCEVTMDAESIRRKLQGRPVPASLRGVIWQVVMRVRSKPDALSGQTLTIAENDCALKTDCQVLAERFAPEGETEQVAIEMEEILGFYGRSKGTEYTSSLGWAELLAPFMSVPLDRGDRYNCFYVLMSKYAIKDCSRESVCYDVFRLLLLYHDSELCNVLDSLRIGPQDFAQTWVRSMFARWCDGDVALPLWDSYFMAEDQYFVFFLSLVMLVNGRDYVFQLAESPETLATELESLPSQLTNEDIGDMCELAEHFSSITPQSFRADYSSKLFGGSPRKRQAAGPDDMFTTLCLAVPVETVLRHTEGAIKFFVIDTRPLYMYDAGHLPYAWHLDASLMIDNPQIFGEEVTKLEEALTASMQHPCFISSGRDEEDSQLAMVVARFLQKHHKYVSVVKGGFEALHKLLTKQGRVTTALDGHAGDRKVEPREDVEEEMLLQPEAPKEKAPSKWGAKLKGWGASISAGSAAAAAAYKKKAAVLAEKSKEYKASLKEKSKEWGKKKDGKALYRGGDRGKGEIFSIDDDDGVNRHDVGRAGGADLDLGSAVARQSADGDLLVHIEKMHKQSAVQYVFKCSEVSTEGYLFPSHLVLTTTHIIKLRDRNPKLAAVLSRRPLTSIAKITAKKKHPNLLTVVFESEPSPSTPPSPQAVEPAVESVVDSPAAAAVAVVEPPAGEDNADPAPPQFEIGDEDDSVDHSFADDADAPSPSEGSAAPTSGAPDLISLGGPAPPSGDLILLDSPAPAPAPAPAAPPSGDLISLGGEAEAAVTTTTNGAAEDMAPLVALESPPSPGGGDAASEPTTPSSPAADGRYVEVREMYMIPEATKAKAAFRDSIIALADQGLSEVSVTPNSKD